MNVPFYVFEEPAPSVVEGARLLGWTLPVAGAAAGSLLVARAWSIRDRRRHGPARRRLARMLGLGAGDRRLLERMAAATGVEAGALLLSRGLFDACAARVAEGLDPGRLAALRVQLHGPRIAAG